MKEGRYRGMKFAEQEHLDSLNRFGICDFKNNKSVSIR
jgi:hypothetical protein